MRLGVRQVVSAPEDVADLVVQSRSRGRERRRGQVRRVQRAFTSLPQGKAAARYASTYNRAGGIRAASDRFSFGPELVALAVRRAMGNRPSARYMAPSLLGLMFALMPFVPTRMLDLLFGWVFGFGRAAPRALEGEPAKR